MLRRLVEALPGMAVILPDWPDPIIIDFAEFFISPRDGICREVVLRLVENNSPWGYVEYSLSEPEGGPDGRQTIMEVRLMRRVHDAIPIASLDAFNAGSRVPYDGIHYGFESRAGGINLKVVAGNVVVTEGFSTWVTFKAELAHEKRVLTYADWGQDPPLACYVGIIVSEDQIQVHLVGAADEAPVLATEEAAATGSDQS